MNSKSLALRMLAAVPVALAAVAAVPPEDAAQVAAPAPSVAEARRRAELLHGVIHDTLQVIHARYFREGEKLAIPAASLELVFDEIQEREAVQLRWLVVDGKAMNIDNRPRDEFEKAAARALAAGERRHEAASYGVYRFAGPITLGAECLKCHLPSRTGNQPRTAGLVISMPIADR